MRRPVLYAVTIVVVLLALGLPFLRVSFGGIDARVLPASLASRQVSEAIDNEFMRNASRPIEVVVSLGGPAADPAQQAAVQRLRGVDQEAVGRHVRAQLTGAKGNTVRVSVGYDSDPDLGHRATARPGRPQPVLRQPAAVVLVGGQTAALADLLSDIGSRLPWMALMVVLTTFVLLFLAFGSVVLPIKAMVMNVLSLSASFGALVWIFQDGHLSGLLGFTPTGTIEATNPILVLAIVFGLSMDYEVFLMSRIREEYDRTGDNTRAVATGLQRTGAIITSAALLLIVVTGAFVSSGIVVIKLIGVAMVIAIIIDATWCDMLVPATMRLLGKANWYAPAPLRRFYARYGIRESDERPERNVRRSGSDPGAR